jgi:hypothetical protein
LKIVKKLAPVAKKLAVSKLNIIKKLHTAPLKLLKKTHAMRMKVLRRKKGGAGESEVVEVMPGDEVLPGDQEIPGGGREPEWGGVIRPMPALPPRDEMMQPAYVKPPLKPAPATRARDPREWLQELTPIEVEPQSGVELLQYVRDNEPRAWAAIQEAVPQAAMAVNKSGVGMHGLAQDDAETGIDWGGIINSAVTAGSGLMNLIQNQRIFKANLERAQAGKPPIPPAQAAAMVPPMRAAATVGLDPATRRMITYVAVGGGVLVLGLGAVFMMAKRGPSRSRRHSF